MPDFHWPSSVITGYPVYDGHGNMIACLFKSGGSYALNDQRSYDAWGNIRAGNTTGDPKARYVANLGHLADDESGLTYMRARYYEPSSGRFVSEDPAMDGWNWFVYCGNDPTNFTDNLGKARFWIQIGDFEVSFDWFLPKGSNEVMGDIHWRPIGSNAKDGMGSIRLDGVRKHGELMPQELRDLLANGKGRAGKKHASMCRGIGIAADSVRASFNADPFDTMSILFLALYGLDMVWNQDAWGT